MAFITPIDPAELVSVLEESRRFVRDELDTVLESHCRLTAELEPRHETLDESAGERVAEIERLLWRIDRVLAAARTQV